MITSCRENIRLHRNQKRNDEAAIGQTALSRQTVLSFKTSLAGNETSPGIQDVKIYATSFGVGVTGLRCFDFKFA